MTQEPGPGRAASAVLGLAFVAGGLLLLASLEGWLSVDWRLVAPVVLVAIGAAFLAGAVLGRGWAAWCAQAGPWGWWGAGGDARGAGDARDAQDARDERLVGLYWMGVMGVFFLLLAVLMARNLLGLGALSWSIIGPYFILAVGGMFFLRALVRARGGGDAGGAGPPGAG